ncbi:MAG: hypothetical protein KIT31_27300 [Deltaproteobacteria bacterium]|nr:hypothetical protein [Deltaproteobacteria bacterium]
MIKRIYRYQPATDSESVIGIFELRLDGTIRPEYPDAERTGFDESIEDGRVRALDDKRLVYPRDGRVFFDAIDRAFAASSMIRVETTSS